jgi:hypothetical protein
VVQVLAPCLRNEGACDSLDDSRQLYASIMRIGWGLATAKVKTAKRLLTAIGEDVQAPPPPSLFLPRTEQEVGASIFGLTAKHLCAKDGPQQAIQPCQTLHDILTAGIGEDEEADLNEALSGIVAAYGLGSATP